MKDCAHDVFLTPERLRPFRATEQQIADIADDLDDEFPQCFGGSVVETSASVRKYLDSSWKK